MEAHGLGEYVLESDAIISIEKARREGAEAVREECVKHLTLKSGQAGDRARENYKEPDECSYRWVEEALEEAAAFVGALPLPPGPPTTLETVARERDMARAEVEMLRGVGCNEGGDGPCGVCLKCVRREGEKVQREACAQHLDTLLRLKGATAIWVSADEVRNTPLVTDET